MLYYLLQDVFPETIFTNLFRYITFRAFGAAVLSFLIVVLLMPSLIRFLQRKSVRQVVRDDGPKTHLTKTGTPTMGGLLMVIGISLSILLFCRWDVEAIWIALFSLLSFGSVG